MTSESFVMTNVANSVHIAGVMIAVGSAVVSWVRAHRAGQAKTAADTLLITAQATADALLVTARAEAQALLVTARAEASALLVNARAR